MKFKYKYEFLEGNTKLVQIDPIPRFPLCNEIEVLQDFNKLFHKLPYNGYLLLLVESDPYIGIKI